MKERGKESRVKDGGRKAVVSMGDCAAPKRTEVNRVNRVNAGDIITVSDTCHRAVRIEIESIQDGGGGANNNNREQESVGARTRWVTARLSAMLGRWRRWGKVKGRMRYGQGTKASLK